MSELKENASYQWSPDSDITIKGIEYDQIQKMLNFHRQILMPALAANDQIFKRMVEMGIATEVSASPSEE